MKKKSSSSNSLDKTIYREALPNSPKSIFSEMEGKSGRNSAVYRSLREKIEGIEQ
jgi:hypothetical protein